MAKAAKKKTSPAAKKAAAVRKAKALVPEIAQAKAAAAEPPKTALSKKAHPREAALKSAKKPVGEKASKLAERDTAAAKSRGAALTGRSQLNFRG